MTNITDDSLTSKERHDWLLEKYTEIAALAGGLAHEIKNPLSTLNLNLQLMAEDFTVPETAREKRALKRIETLQKEVMRLEAILDDFLRFAKITELKRIPTDLNEVVAEIADFYSPQAQSAGIVVRVDLPPGLPTVLLDASLFKQALLNLMLNAQHAMPNGGELILKTYAKKEGVFVEVIDTGVGMTPETMERIFKPFFSTRKDGSGLGLPTTKKIIEAHQGRLLVQSERGKGTAFTIILPCEV